MGFGIHDLIMEKVQTELTKAMITDIDEDDPTRAGIVMIGQLQGEPMDVDQARIFCEIFPNDPDKEYKTGQFTNSYDAWADEVELTEIGGGIIWRRRFTIKGRCLFTNTQEGLDTSRQYASTVLSRVIRTLLTISFNGVATDTENVIQGAFSDRLQSEFVQGGGPPGDYDYHWKIKFDVLTQENIGV